LSAEPPKLKEKPTPPSSPKPPLIDFVALVPQKPISSLPLLSPNPITEYTVAKSVAAGIDLEPPVPGSTSTSKKKLSRYQKQKLLHSAGFYSTNGRTNRTKEHQAYHINEWAKAEGLPPIAKWEFKPKKKYIRYASPQPRRESGRFISKVSGEGSSSI